MVFAVTAQVAKLSAFIVHDIYCLGWLNLPKPQWNEAAKVPGYSFWPREVRWKASLAFRYCKKQFCCKMVAVERYAIIEVCSVFAAEHRYYLCQNLFVWWHFFAADRNGLSKIVNLVVCGLAWVDARVRNQNVSSKSEFQFSHLHCCVVIANTSQPLKRAATTCFSVVVHVYQDNLLLVLDQLC